MRAEAHVEMKNAFLLGLNPAQEFLRQPFEEFAVLDALLPAGLARALIDE